MKTNPNSATPANQANALIKRKKNVARTLGPVSDLERHLPTEWWKSLFNSLYLKTDGDVVENELNTVKEVDLLVNSTGVQKGDALLDLCCGQGRHSLELARRGFRHVSGMDRSRYLVRLARKRARNLGLEAAFSEGDARKIRLAESSQDCVFIMGNSFGYFEKEEDDIAVLSAIKTILKSKGKLALDLVDGPWMAKNFEPRSWEWIDQNHFVNRERSLDQQGKRIISRELISHAEKGILADQFYAERLYSFDEIKALLESLDFTDVTMHGNIIGDSTRGQDLGMMANRLFLTAVGPEKASKTLPKKQKAVPITVIMGDPRLPDSVKKNGQFNEEDLDTIRILKKNLAELDRIEEIYLDDHSTLMRDLNRNPPKLVLNLCDEGYQNSATKELHVPALLEMLNIPYTGAGPGCLSLCYNKSLVRAIALSLEIPVPMETYIEPDDQAANLPSVFPALLKPSTGDSSIGITQNSVVHNAQELIAYAAYLREILPGVPILVQEYLSGTEYSVGLVGNADKFLALPILEVDFSKLPKELPPILSYESKWLPESPYWNEISYKEAALSEEVQRLLIDHSRLLFERLECRDYARFDFRADADGTIKLLEVNPNPGWCWDGKFNLMAGFANMSYAELLDAIIVAALDRLDLHA